MAVMKQMDMVAEEMATDTIEQIYQDCDWQISQFLPEACEGVKYKKAIGNSVSLFARTIPKNLEKTTIKYTNE